MAKSTFCHTWALASLLLLGCWSRSSQHDTVVVYTALDSEFSGDIFDSFQQETGIAVQPKFDVESTKTVGLVNAIIAEQERPRCDVFWNNEILNTIRLQRLGLLEPYAPPVAEEYPEMYRADDGSWHGFAARARVLIVNTDLVTQENRPSSMYDLLDERWRGRIGIAKPLFGTTASHAACLFAVLGDEPAREYFRALKANDVRILAGNKQVALSVAAGDLAFGLTDTDDAIIELEKGRPVAIVYPDSQPGELGTLFIPNTVSIIKGCRHPVAARELVSYVLSPEVEARLAASRSAQIPLNPAVKVPVRVETPHTIQAMKVDFEQAADWWDTAAEFIRDEFTGSQ